MRLTGVGKKLSSSQSSPLLCPSPGNPATLAEFWDISEMELLESIKFRSFVENLLHQNRIPGLSIAIVHNHDIASSGYGMANYEDDISCTGDTLFDIASCSKSLTAGSVALLVNDTRHPQVQYEALMSDLLPDDFVMQERIYTESITVEDLLSHRTGMAR